MSSKKEKGDGEDEEESDNISKGISPRKETKKKQVGSGEQTKNSKFGVSYQVDPLTRKKYLPYFPPPVLQRYSAPDFDDPQFQLPEKRTPHRPISTQFITGREMGRTYNPEREAGTGKNSLMVAKPPQKKESRTNQNPLPPAIDPRPLLGDPLFLGRSKQIPPPIGPSDQPMDEDIDGRPVSPKHHVPFPPHNIQQPSDRTSQPVGELSYPNFLQMLQQITPMMSQYLTQRRIQTMGENNGRKVVEQYPSDMYIPTANKRKIDSCISMGDFLYQFCEEKTLGQGAIKIRGPKCHINTRSYVSIFLYKSGLVESEVREEIDRKDEELRARKKKNKDSPVKSSEGGKKPEEKEKKKDIDEKGESKRSDIAETSLLSKFNSLNGITKKFPKRNFRFLRERTDGNGKILIVHVNKLFFPLFDWANQFRITKFCRMYDRSRNMRRHKNFRKMIEKSSYLFYSWPSKDSFVFCDGKFVRMNKHVCRLLTTSDRSQKKKKKKLGYQQQAGTVTFQLRMDNMNGNIRGANPDQDISNSTSKEFLVVLEDKDRRMIAFTFLFEYNSGTFNRLRKRKKSVAGRESPYSPQVPDTVSQTRKEMNEVKSTDSSTSKPVAKPSGKDPKKPVKKRKRKRSKKTTGISVPDPIPKPPSIISAPLLSVPTEPKISLLPTQTSKTSKPPKTDVQRHGLRSDQQEEYYLCRTFDLGLLDERRFGVIFGNFEKGLQHEEENEGAEFESLFGEKYVDHDQYDSERKVLDHMNLRRKGNTRKRGSGRRDIESNEDDVESKESSKEQDLSKLIPPLPPLPPMDTLADVSGSVPTTGPTFIGDEFFEIERNITGKKRGRNEEEDDDDSDQPNRKK